MMAIAWVVFAIYLHKETKKHNTKNPNRRITWEPYGVLVSMLMMLIMAMRAHEIF